MWRWFSILDSCCTVLFSCGDLDCLREREDGRKGVGIHRDGDGDGGGDIMGEWEQKGEGMRDEG